jgi:membrane protease YdiL (CAAX protease family)
LGCATFDYQGRAYALVGLMLFLPLWDRDWHPPHIPRSKLNYLAWSVVLTGCIALLAWQPRYLDFAMSTLLLAALPEEWFFRAYFMAHVGSTTCANVVASLLFSMMHGLTRDWTTALLVFVPSLLYGWLYQRTRDFPLLVLVHTLSNLIFAMFLVKQLNY